MVTVALAGATSGFGLTMLRTFIHLNKEKNEHKLVLLSRSEQPQFVAQGVDVRPVDYKDHAQLVEALHDVHTLLSTTGGANEALLDAQLALIAAAKEAGVKRWAPSEYAGKGYENIDLYKPKAIVLEATRASGLEYTVFETGMFMSLLGNGTPKPITEVGKREGAKTGAEEALAGMRPWDYTVNLTAGTADFPGDGHGKFVLTEMRDIATFVWLALSLPKWQEVTSMRGDVKSFRDILAILERVQGRKFLVRETSLEDMKKAAEEPAKRFYNQSLIALATGWGMVGDDLNREFPDFKPTTTEEFIEKWWSGVELGEPRWTENKIFGARDFSKR